MSASTISVPLVRRGVLSRPLLSLPAMSASLLASTIMVVLLVGIGCAVLTTTDPLWWHLHFSRLGEFRDISGYFFNGTLITGGALIVVFARRVHADLRILGARRARRGVAAHVNSTLITCVGISLGSVGMVPLNINQFLHDKAASGIVLSFAALLIASTCLLRTSIKRLGLANAAAFVLIVIAATFFVSGTINLALFEALGFSTIFGWVGVFTRVLGASIRAGHTEESPAAVQSVPQTLIAPRSPKRDTHIVSTRPVARRAASRPRVQSSAVTSRRTHRSPSSPRSMMTSPPRARRVTVRGGRTLGASASSATLRAGSARAQLIRQ